jgi:N-acetylmuramoyl-L-alanine amidase
MKKIRFMQGKRIITILLVFALACGAIYLGMDKVQTSSMTSAQPDKSKVIVLDAGHGGLDGGCSTADGVPEKGINLNILLDLRDMLRAEGYQVEVTRDTDKSIHDKGVEGIANQKSSDMDNRLAIFNKYPDALCFSIHQNQYTDPKYSGAQMFYSESNDQSEYMAQILQKKFVQYIQPDNKREIKKCGKELFLCYFSKNPTVMIECGFLSNAQDAENLKTEEYQKKVAFTIFSAINEYMANKK